jgi:hypothetical protein
MRVKSVSDHAHQPESMGLTCSVVPAPQDVWCQGVP